MAIISPVSDLRNYNTVLEQVSAGSPVYLTVNGRGRFTIRDIADDDLDRHDGNAANKAVSVVQLLDEVGLDAMLFQHLKQVIAHQIIDNAFADNRALLQTVERGGIILVIHDEQLGIIGFEYFFCFALVDLF